MYKASTRPPNLSTIPVKQAHPIKYHNSLKCGHRVSASSCGSIEIPKNEKNPCSIP